MSPAPTFYTTDEVAEILKVTAKTVRDMIARKQIKALKIGREYRISEEHLQQFIDENQA
ncbi:MAG TPA: helix-turn-helix domain-containing protein [Methanolinea sp.]|nr:helix-turn-helix domain-containing protein [Methanolinea sp.]